MKMQKLCSIRTIVAVLVVTLATLVPVTLAASGQLPPGAYAITITPVDIPPDLPPEAATILIGNWTVRFTDDGSTVVFKDGDVVATGRYTSNKSHLVMRDIDGPLACTDAPGIATGVYTWHLVNGQLHFSAVLDRCFGRQFVLTLRPLQQL